MHSALIALAMTAQAAPAATVPIDAAQANWRAFPRLVRAERQLPTPDLADRVEAILQRQCRLPGQSAAHFDIDVPFAVLLEPDGTPSRIIVQDMKCPPLETMVGEVALQLGRQGDFKPTGLAGARWFADSLNFNVE